MAGLLKRSSRNYLRRHPGQLLLALLGIALGVAVVVAIDLALESAFRSFELASKTLSGRATHLIGEDNGLDERLYTRLRVEQGIGNISPVIRDYVALAQNPDERYTLYGIDPLIEKNFQSAWQSRLNDGNSPHLLRQLLAEPNSVLIGERTARRLKMAARDSFSILTGSGSHSLTVIGLIEAPNAVSEQLLDRLIIADIATAQELTGLYGKLSYIELLLPANAGQKAVLEKIRNVMPGNLQITEVAAQAGAVREMTDAFSVNLKALGLLSLLVGLFLIYNAMLFLVVQRRGLLGALRALGVTRREIFRLILEEALLLAIAGTVIGITTGIGIGGLLLPSISTTLNSVYYPLESSVLLVSAGQVIKAAVLGIGATLLAVLPPAFEATRVSPASALTRSRLESGSKRLIQFSGGLGLLLIVTGFTVIQLSETSVRFSLAGIFLLMFGFALLTPGATLALLTGFDRLFEKRSIIGRLPPRLISAEISRTGIAMAALMVAVAATIGMDLMITSFRQTVSDWIETSLQGDIYIALSGNLAAPGKAVKDRELKAAIAALPDVAMASSVLRTQLPTPNDGSLPIAVFDLNDRSHAGFRFLQKADNVWERFEQEQSILLTEAYAYHHRLRVGDNLPLLAPDGPTVYKVIGIYADYSGDRGHIAMSRNQYLRYWPDLGFTGIGVYAAAHADARVLEKAIRSRLSAGQTVRSARAIYDASMAVFEQTFAITETLRLLAAGIAIIGVFGALTALQLERIRQTGILRAIGLTPGQLYRLVASETGLMGLCAGLFALPVGYLIAYQLIYVIYRRSFGWTMAFHFHPEILLQGLLLAFGAGLLAGILPARRMASINPAEALRAE